jgi:arylsulfatase A-like enzyme
MSWFEASARVPLLISYPKRFEPGYINHSVSSMDLLPTLVDLVGQTTDPRLPLDGRSLVPFLEGNGSPRTVYGEYLGEGTVAPLMMIRRGPWKFVTCPVDPPQLFNLDEDPRELTNLATSTDATVKQAFQAFELEANARWDFKRIHAEVLKSQRSRKLCWDALTRGRFQSWDYQPRELASDQ